MEKIIIDFEGIDGVGKGTQSKILYNKLLSKGYNVNHISFPNYNSFFGKMIGKYLNGEYGNLSSVPVEFSSLLYALDRWKYFSENNIKNDGSIYIMDRYVPSNIAHQASKISHDERKCFIDWMMHLEYNIFNIPKPDIVLLLDANPNTTSEYILKKEKRLYTERKKDIHEQDQEYLEEVRRIFLELSKSDNTFYIINCTNGNELQSIDEISDKIWEIVLKFLNSTDL